MLSHSMLLSLLIGLLFPLHILLGLAAVPLVLAALFVWRSPWAWALAACYAPLYAQPAHRGSSAVPGWQSTRFARALWRWALSKARVSLRDCINLQLKETTGI